LHGAAVDTADANVAAPDLMFINNDRNVAFHNCDNFQFKLALESQ
jgi:hypothetical protein